MAISSHNKGKDFTTEDLEGGTRMGWRPSYGLTQMWEDYCQELPLLADMKISHCIIVPKAAPYELTGFCDALEGAYSVVVWSQSLYLVKLRWHFSRRYPYLTLSWAVQ
jgi:hypothetical protein